MSDLISREALLKELRDWARSLDSLSENVLMAAIECTCVQIEEFPAVDAEPVKHARWERAKASFHKKCSYCKSILHMPRERNYCPNCGAKMDTNL